MNCPEAVERLASKVVRSWTSKKSNYIIVAPPLAEPHRLFGLLASRKFHCSILGEAASQLAIARIGQADFRNHSKLALSVLRGWNLNSEIDVDPESPLGSLEMALDTLNGAQRIPILLVDRFHDAIRWVDGDFGVALRDLENEHFLKTVVAIPVHLKELQRRARADPDGSLFLQSDWGQAHSEKLLKGYSESEIGLLLKERNVDPELSKVLARATSGLPDLVDRLVDEIGKSIDSRSLEEFLRVEAPLRCFRLLEWLDCKGEDIYKRLAIEALANSKVRIRGVALTDHSWADMLVGAEGVFTCQMLGWAATHQLASERNSDLIERLVEHARNRKFLRIAKMLPSSRRADEASAEVWNALEITNRFCLCTDIYQSEWAGSAECLVEINQLAGRTKNDSIKELANNLCRWDILIELMRTFSNVRKSKNTKRLEEFVCEKKSTEAFSAFLQFHRLRLKMSATLAALPAMKTVIETPESVIQVYGYYKFGLQFWNFQGLAEEKWKTIEGMFRRTLDAPRVGSRLGFQELLWLTYFEGALGNASARLFERIEDVFSLEKQYRDRTEQVHSASFASKEDWDAYRHSCLKFIELVEKSVTGDISTQLLPDPVECFCELANALKAGAIL